MSASTQSIVGESLHATTSEQFTVTGRYLIISDTHQNSQAFWRILREAKPYDAIFCAGDIEDYGDMGAPFYFCAGNHDLMHAEKLLLAKDMGLVQFKNFMRITSGKVYTFANLRIAGLPGNYAPTDYNKPRRLLTKQSHFTKEEVENTLRLGNISILLTHEAPKGVSDLDWRTNSKHYGVQPVRDILDTIRPRFMICGHIHSQQIERYKDTVVLNSGYGVHGEYAILDDARDTVEFYKNFKLVETVVLHTLVSGVTKVIRK